MIGTMYKSQIESMGANPATNPFVALALANRQAFGFCDAGVIGKTRAIAKKMLPGFYATGLKQLRPTMIDWIGPREV